MIFNKLIFRFEVSGLKTVSIFLEFEKGFAVSGEKPVSIFCDFVFEIGINLWGFRTSFKTVLTLWYFYKVIFRFFRTFHYILYLKE